MAGPGGRRRGAGRPNGSKNRADSARQWAANLWDRHDCDKIVGEILKGGDMREKTPILLKLMEYKWGKPIQTVAGAAGAPIAVQIITNAKLPHE